MLFPWASTYAICLQDSAVVQDPEGEGKIVYLFLPLYKVRSPFFFHSRLFAHATVQKGNLQDTINANVVNGTHFSEREMLRLFKGTCLAVRAMHDHHEVAQPATTSVPNGTAKSSENRPKASQDDDDDDERFPQPEGDAEGGYSYDSQVPLMTRERTMEVVFDGDEEESRQNGDAQRAVDGKKELVPYAHRDLKPGFAPVRVLKLVLADRRAGT
jgi:serine/threonine kinase 16